MGQRAFRGQLTNSLMKNYLSNQEQTLDQYSLYFKGKPINLNIDFDLFNPLKNIDLSTVNLTKGLINLNIPNGSRINSLNVVINSNLFGQNMGYLHSNLYILFGNQFVKDITKIDIKLYNPFKLEYFKDRKIIKNILEYMCFKTIKLIKVNQNMLFYVIPEYTDFCIVLAYREINCHVIENLDVILEELFFHPYCLFEGNEYNFSQCLRAMDMTIPKEIDNIILPVIALDYSKKDIEIFSDVINFLNTIMNRFFIISIEFRVKISSTLFLIKLLELFSKDMIPVLKKFKYSIISFNFAFDVIETEDINKDIFNAYMDIIKEKEFFNATLAHHISYTILNLETGLEDEYEYYDYVYYDLVVENEIKKILTTIKAGKDTTKLYKRKHIIKQIIESQIGIMYFELFKRGRFNYSTNFVKNSKIIPFEFNRNNTIIFSN